MLVTTVVTQVWLVPFLVLVVLLVVVGVLLLVGILLAFRDRRKGPPDAKAIILIVLAVCLAIVAALLGYSAYQDYVVQNTSTFTYSVSIWAEGTAPESIVLPIPKDEGLLTGLHLTNGTANWSLVDTEKGRGLYITFEGSASLRVDVAILPPPSPTRDTGPTMEVPYVASVSDYGWWVFYDGQAGGALDLNLGCYDLHASLVPGWTSAEPWCLNPQLPPLA